MSGRPNQAWLETMIKKHGSREAVARIMAEIGSRGGKNSNHGGYASQKVGADGLTGRERARVNGAVGGTRSKRVKG